MSYNNLSTTGNDLGTIVKNALREIIFEVNSFGNSIPSINHFAYPFTFQQQSLPPSLPNYYQSQYPGNAISTAIAQTNHAPFHFDSLAIAKECKNT